MKCDAPLMITRTLSFPPLLWYDSKARKSTTPKCFSLDLLQWLEETVQSIWVVQIFSKPGKRSETMHLTRTGRTRFPSRRWIVCVDRLLLTYGDAGEVILNGKGAGGLAEMKSQLNDNQVYFGVVRVRAVDDHGSKRAKFVFVTFVGAGVVSIPVFYDRLFLSCSVVVCFSLLCVVLVCQPTSLNSNGYSMAIIYKSMPTPRTIFRKKRLLHRSMAVPARTSPRLTSSRDCFSVSVWLVSIVLMFVWNMSIRFFLRSRPTVLDNGDSEIHIKK